MKNRIISLLLIALMCFSLPVSAEENAVEVLEEAPKLQFTDVQENSEE